METSQLRASVPFVLIATSLCGVAWAQVDPGVRSGASAGGALTGLTAGELAFFDAGRVDFIEAEGVGDGLGPRFNLDGCAGCHSQPAIGGSAPSVNPQVAIATAFGARNTVPSFITLNGPVREARFIYDLNTGEFDGGVHALYTISGRVDATGNASACSIAQENFATHLFYDNVVFRIPTPVFGAGLMEMIPDATLRASVAATASARSSLGISPVFNVNPNDGQISRFGWKAQNQSMLMFSGEAYNVEMGITNELFQGERDTTSACQFATLPNDVTTVDAATPVDAASAVEKFAFFMRLLAPPSASTTTPGGSTSINNGRTLFSSVGCNLCHTPTLQTGPSTVPALSNKAVNLYSDLALHDMGPTLADYVEQGVSQGDEFRTAPLWGLGQRIFLLHDGRTTDLRVAIAAHRSFGNFDFEDSEAIAVIDRYNALTSTQKQDILNFLRSL